MYWGRSHRRQGNAVSKHEFGPNMVHYSLVPKQEQSLSWLPTVPRLTAKPAEALSGKRLAAVDVNGP